MSDYVTRLESELHRAARRQERAGSLRGAALPRLRALPGLAATAGAIVSIALVLAGVAAVFLGSERDGAAGGSVPAALRGTWRLPGGTAEEGLDPVPTALRLYPGGSERCTGLGVGANPCYAIDNGRGGALEWGTFSVAGDEITFRAAVNSICRPGPCDDVGTPGVYRWRVQDQSLSLTKLRDGLRARLEVLVAGPLTLRMPPPKTRIPDGWTASRFTSQRYGYSIRYPSDWSALAAARPMPPDGLATDTSDAVDKFSRDPRAGETPIVLIAASEVPMGTTYGRWMPQIKSRVEGSGACAAGGGMGNTSVDGEPAIIVSYADCNERNQQWAAFVHDDRGYQVAWWGEPRRGDADEPLFVEILKTFRFHD
jgi:hypothetical protein